VPLRIAETRNIQQAVPSKEPWGLFFVAQMHEGECCALGFNGAALFRESSATASRQKVQPKCRRNTRKTVAISEARL
jgi:hypothetical protein